MFLEKNSVFRFKMYSPDDYQQTFDPEAYFEHFFSKFVIKTFRLTLTVTLQKISEAFVGEMFDVISLSFFSERVFSVNFFSESVSFNQLKNGVALLVTLDALFQRRGRIKLFICSFSDLFLLERIPTIFLKCTNPHFNSGTGKASRMAPVSLFSVCRSSPISSRQVYQQRNDRACSTLVVFSETSNIVRKRRREKRESEC